LAHREQEFIFRCAHQDLAAEALLDRQLEIGIVADGEAKLMIVCAQRADNPSVSPTLKPGARRAILASRLRLDSCASIGPRTHWWRLATVQPRRVLATAASITSSLSNSMCSGSPSIHQMMPSRRRVAHA
jgi:hypothetical protein